jgi:hypothetical protein
MVRDKARVTRTKSAGIIEPKAHQGHDPQRQILHSIGFSGRQKSLDCQRHLPRYFPCAPSSQLRNLSENRSNNISNLKIYH